MATNTSKQCSITNHCGSDILAACTTNINESSSSAGVPVANGKLEILKTASGGLVIKNGGTDTVSLDRSYQPGAPQTGAVISYALQLLDLNWLHPVSSSLLYRQSDNGSTGFDSQTVTKNDVTQMNCAADFYQTIMAYPDSQLTTDYTTALQSAKDAVFANSDNSEGSAALAAVALEDAMDDFFKSNDKYSTVTLGDVVAIDGYYRNFPAVWAQFKDDITYYLYSSDEAAASFSGTLVLKKSGPMDATKAAGGYSCSFVPAADPADTSRADVNASAAITLSYVNGWFTEDPKAASPKIGLKGSFMLKRLFTTESADNSMLSVMTGTVNGLLCVGFDKPQAASSSPDTAASTATATVDPAAKYWDTLVHPKTQHDLLISLLTLAGVILLIPAVGSVVYGIYRILKYKAAVREALSKQIVERTWQDVQDAEIEALNSEAVQFTRPIGDQLGKFYIEFNPKNEAGYNKIIENDMLANKLMRAFETQAECLAKMLEFYHLLSPGEKNNIEDQLDFIGTSVDNLQNSWRTDLEKVLPVECDNFYKVQSQVKMIDTTVHHKLDDAAQKLMDDNITAGSRLFDQIEKARTEETKETEENDPVLQDTLIPELETIL